MAKRGEGHFSSLWRAAGVQPEANAPPGVVEKRSESCKVGGWIYHSNPSPKGCREGGKEEREGGRHLAAMWNPNVYAKAQTKTDSP